MTGGAKVEIFLEQLEAHQDALGSVRAGTALRVAQHDGGSVACFTAEGSVVGLLPPNLAPHFRHGSWVATVRSLKRADNAVTQLQVRLARGEPPPGPSRAAPAAHQEEDQDDVARLTRDQLEQLAQDEEVRWMLRDERLQKVVQEIDGAPDRERALLRALQAPNFKEFADKVLLRVAPEPV